MLERERPQPQEAQGQAAPSRRSRAATSARRPVIDGRVASRRSLELAGPPLVAPDTTRIRRRAAPADDVGADGGPLTSVTEQAIQRARGGGRPLDDHVRARMECAFGADLSTVRLHTGPEATALGDRIQASAFTVGRDVFLGDDVPALDRPSGMHLLAHELAHTIQQGATARSMTGRGERVQRGPGKKDKKGKKTGKAEKAGKAEKTEKTEKAEKAAVPTAAPALGWGAWFSSFIITPDAPIPAQPAAPKRETPKPSDEALPKRKATPTAVKEKPEPPAAIDHVEVNRRKQMAEKQAVKDKALQKERHRQQMAEKQQAAEQRKREVAEQEKRERIAAAVQAVETSAELITAGADKVIIAATAASIGSGALRSLVATFKQQRVAAEKATKPDWLKVKSSMDGVEVATRDLQSEVDKAADKLEGTYTSESGPVLVGAESARKEAAPFRIDVTELTAAVAEHDRLAIAVPKKYPDLNRSIRQIKERTVEVNDTIGDARRHETWSKTWLDAGVNAALAGEHALSRDRDHPRESDYWQHLRAAVEALSTATAEHAALMEADRPDWSKAYRAAATIKGQADWVEREIAVAPHRGDDRVGWSHETDAIERRRSATIDGDGEPNERVALKETLDSIDGKWPKDSEGRPVKWQGGEGGKWGAHHGNYKGHLPADDYEEYYVRPPKGRAGHGRRRVVVGSDGRRWYTWTHYGENGKPAFVLLDAPVTGSDSSDDESNDT